MKKPKPSLSPDKIKKILEDPEFINAKRYNNNLKEMIDNFPNGCPDRIGASVLGLSLEEYEEKYEKALVKLRELMGVDIEN